MTYILKPVSPVPESTSCDPIQMSGRATLASMLYNCYAIMKFGILSQKDKISSEIHILQRLVATGKSQAPEYLQYRDEGHVYLPCVELLPFIKEVDVIYGKNEEGFENHGRMFVDVTVSSVMSEGGLSGCIQNVSACCFSNPEELYCHLRIYIQLQEYLKP